MLGLIARRLSPYSTARRSSARTSFDRDHQSSSVSVGTVLQPGDLDQGFVVEEWVNADRRRGLVGVQILLSRCVSVSYLDTMSIA